MKVFVNEALPLAVCLVLVRLILDILKQIQKRVIIDSKQIFFELKLFDLDYSDLFICNYLVTKRVKRIPADAY